MANEYDAVAVAGALAQVARRYGPKGALALALALGRLVAVLQLPLADVLATVASAHADSHV